MGFGRAEFGFGPAPAGISAAMKQLVAGRSVSPEKGGARLYVTSGMSHEATQELGGWKSLGVMKKVYNKARSEDVAP